VLKISIGINDLSTTHPKIAKQAIGWDPSSVSAGSDKRRRWICEYGHEWDTQIKNRTQGKGCPFCANRKLLIGFNDLETTHPEIAKQAIGWDPSLVITGSNKKFPWKCKEGHVWEITLNARINMQSGCPYCANKKVLKGFNDLLTTHPEIAKQADGWDPSSVTAGSGKKKRWICKKNHKWITDPVHRTRKKTGCPYCANQKVLKGFNDLATTHPEIAKQADGWDPCEVIGGSHKKKLWKCERNHKWYAAINCRATQNTGCPICSGRNVNKGINDLLKTHPEIAKQADGWDPCEYSSFSNKKLNWICSLGHKWQVNINTRTRQNSGCPYCANKKVLKGFNDLATTHPEIAKQADGWDPSTVIKGSNKFKSWKCDLGHTWTAVISSRNKETIGCPYCNNNKVLKGFNDLATTHPEIAKQADGWDPTLFVGGCNERKDWKCEKNHKWKVSISNRTQGTICPVCAETGFSVDKPAWFYLLEREGEQQLGISNYINKRIRFHQTFGWKQVDLVGPYPGNIVLETERKYKRWIKEHIGLIKNKTENWQTKDLKVDSLKDLKLKSGIETTIF
tara:strand:+ start:1927 stop:3621 length:1695 start_codon:yes stop_codon:yes gene_type:complete